MTLRARLTLIYGGLLALVFVALGFGGRTIMQSSFANQTRLTLTSAAQYVNSNYTLLVAGHQRLVPLLPANPQKNPFKNPGLYFEIAGPKGQIISRSAGLKPATIRPNRRLLNQAIQHRRSSFGTVSLGGDQLQVYYSPLVYTSTARGKANDVVLVAKSQADISRAVNLFDASLFGGEALLWLVVVGVTWLVAGSALRPTQAMTERAASIAETKDFSGRVPVDTRATELQRLAITFNQMLTSLEEAYANQQRFLADASHELRTPLTVIQGNLHYLEAAPDAPHSEREDALHAARIEADRMGMLVGDLLALSHADAGYSIQREPVELDRVVVDAYRRIKSREQGSHSHDVPVQLRLGRLDEFVVTGDYDRLLQLVLILLDNAVKYTPPGGSAQIELSAISSDQATICVADTGIGIPPDEREHVFERFYRARAARGMNEGSGLGLAIAKWIAEAHGGEIDFRDAAGGGTIFVATLPGEAPSGFSEHPTESVPLDEPEEDLVLGVAAGARDPASSTDRKAATMPDEEEWQ